MDTRLKFFNAFHVLSEAEYALLCSKLQPKKFLKGEIIIHPGQTQRQLYFINSGVQMSYFETEKKTHVVAFTYAPGPCALPDSFPMQQPSKYFLTSLSDSEVEYITYNNLQELFSQSQAIETLFRKMTEAILAGVINRHTELHSLTIEERYKAFCNRSGHLLQLVPHKYIASYLGIDATNFSKLYNTVKI